MAESQVLPRLLRSRRFAGQPDVMLQCPAVEFLCLRAPAVEPQQPGGLEVTESHLSAVVGLTAVLALQSFRNGQGLAEGLFRRLRFSGSLQQTPQLDVAANQPLPVLEPRGEVSRPLPRKGKGLAMDLPRVVRPAGLHE